MDRRVTTPFALTAKDIGAVVDMASLPPDAQDAVRMTGATVLCRIAHEHGLRRGTFLGFANPSQPSLQRWGTFFHESVDQRLVFDREITTRPADAPVTPETLTRADLLPMLDGVRWDGMPARFGHWWVGLVDHNVAWDGRPVTNLGLVDPSHPHDRETLIHVEAGTPLVPYRSRA